MNPYYIGEGYAFNIIVAIGLGLLSVVGGFIALVSDIIRAKLTGALICFVGLAMTLAIAFQNNAGRPILVFHAIGPTSK